MKKILIAFITLALVGCSTGVKVNDGKITDSGYLNESINLKIELAGEMQIFTEEQLKQVTESGKEAITENTGLQAGDVKVVFFAINPMTNANISITIESSLGQSVAAVAQQLSSQASALYAGNEGVEVSEAEEVELAGETWTRLKTQVIMNGQAIYQTTLMRIVDKKLISIGLTAGNEEEKEALVELLQSVK